MNSDVLARVFEPFFTTKAAGKGTGLGLATVFGIVSQHEGIIECDSVPGRGTVFTIELNASEEPVVTAVAQPAALTAPTAKTAPATILLAEDSAEVRILTAAILQRAGYQVVAAENGEAALTAFSADPPAFALAILDVVMPGLGGREAGAKIRETRDDLPLLFMSGYDAATFDDASAQHPHTRFLAKPFSADELKGVVRTILES
jgi:two-component system cell cycle sensor histidine kinase/response regulator CckA